MLALKTTRMPWLRLPLFLDATDANGKSAVAVGARDLTSLKALTTYFIWKEIPSGINVLETRLLATTNDTDLGDIEVWAGRLMTGSTNTEMARVCTLNVICGLADADDTTHHYAQTITVTNNDWIKTVQTVNAGGTDRQARLVFDLCGYDIVGFYGYGTFVGDWYIEISGY